jgi:hypothetical protein
VYAALSYYLIAGGEREQVSAAKKVVPMKR